MTRTKLRASVLAGLLGGLLGACSGDSVRTANQELADAQAEADEATAVTFGGPPLQACRLLSVGEVQEVIGELEAAPVAPPEDAADTAESRCVWHGSEDRALSLAASGEGGRERLDAIEATTAVELPGVWDEARLQGCCLLHAVKDEALLSLDFSSARIDAAGAVRLMDLALARIHEPLETP